MGILWDPIQVYSPAGGNVSLPDAIVDECDLDNDGHCCGPDMGCIACKETAQSTYGANWKRGTMTLESGCCLATLVEVRS